LKASEDLGMPAITINFEGFFERPRAKKVILKSIRKKYQKGDFFIARFNERKEHLIRPLYSEIEDIFGSKFIFPDSRAVHFYNNKRRQAEFFNRHHYPTPIQQWVETPNDLHQFMCRHSLAFPIVSKKSKGAGSVGVSLINTSDVNYPFVAQEFCKNNDGDIRIMVVGEKILGFTRKNRQHDFRASGSGIIEYVDELPEECVKTAYQVSHECGFRCMAYDFISNNSGRWVIAEISYTFVSEPASNCAYYYSAKDAFKKIKQPIGSIEHLILEELLKTAT
jgi:hypothetical protein